MFVPKDAGETANKSDLYGHVITLETSRGVINLALILIATCATHILHTATRERSASEMRRQMRGVLRVPFPLSKG